MLEGCVDYARGPHTPPSGKSYDAFRQASFIGYQRTSGDEVFDRADAIDYSRSREHPGDNIHAAFAMDSATRYHKASAGCQTVVGTPRRANDPASADRGSWPVFRNEAYDTGQTRFAYMLLRGSFVRDVAASAPGTFPFHLRMGSFGPAVAKLQQNLLGASYDKMPGERYITDAAHVDQDFGPRTLRSLVDYQRGNGLLEDGVAGPVTAAALGIGDWPRG
jgi:peptidoglycan hydrolase-like protein with peptidoglycan-binding domain